MKGTIDEDQPLAGSFSHPRRRRRGRRHVLRLLGLGRSWYGDIRPFPPPNNGDDHIDGGGDPAVVFDREGVVYYADLHFDRTSDTSGIFVARSTNGGFTWTRPCISFGTTDATAVCGGNGDPRQPGDGTVVFTNDPDKTLNGNVPSHDT